MDDLAVENCLGQKSDLPEPTGDDDGDDGGGGQDHHSTGDGDGRGGGDFNDGGGGGGEDHHSSGQLLLHRLPCPGLLLTHLALNAHHQHQ